MNETTKTKVFVGCAGAMVLAAVASHFATQPSASADFSNVGQPFYEDFTSSEQAASLEVLALDPETARLKRFKVENVDGLWRIPSHENYPAEAAARLATTASSVMGLERESLAGRRQADFKRLGVVDPLADDFEDPDEAGQRIRLLDNEGEVLADYIIGKQAEDVVISDSDAAFQDSDNREKYFYVRREDESQTYKVPLKIDLSTKFSDWIDPDLLRVEQTDLAEILVNNYSLEEQAGGNPLMPRALAKVPGDTLKLSKDDSGSWQLAGLDEETEELNTSPITGMINVLEELKIADVRRKSKFRGKDLLTPDLKLNRDPEFEKMPQQFGEAIVNMQMELADKGFNLAGSAEQLEVVSEHGELELLTDEGVVYTLHVGAAFEESDQEIKVSAASDTEEANDDDATAGDNSDEDDDQDAKSRYLMIRVAFEQDRMSDQPVAPTEPAEPTKPEGYVPPPEVDDANDESDSDSEETVEEAGDDEAANSESESDDDSAQDEEPEEPQRPASSVDYDRAMREYEDDKVDYELDVSKFEEEKEDFAERVEEAQQQVKELNERFNDWFYVVSGDNLQALQVTRDELVTTKESSDSESEVQGDAALPDRPDISFPETDLREPLGDESAEADEEMKPSEPVDDLNEASDLESVDDSEEPTIEQPSTQPPTDETPDAASTEAKTE